MKLFNKTTFILGVVASSLFVSCQEDIVDTSPYNQVGEEDAFASPSLIQLAVNGVYNAAQMGIYNGTPSAPVSRGYVWGAAYTEQNEARGEDVVNTQAFYQITYESTYDPTTANNVYYWVDGYRLINRTNLVIDGVTKSVASGLISSDIGNPYIGECLFFRAITHFEFLKQFARPYHLDNGASLGVPYRDIPYNSIENIAVGEAQTRNTVAECYAKAIADLDRAETLLPLKTARAGEDQISKVTKGAAIAFKIKMYMSMRNWTKVLEEYAKISGQYSLTTAYNGVFTSNLNNTESIFSIKNSKDTNPGVNGALPSQFNGRSLLAISPILWRNPLWLADDKRRGETAVVSGARYTRKYKDIVDFTDAAPIIRFADVMLLAAEANARLGNTTTALELLNNVRNRSIATPATQAYTASTFSTTQALVQAILVERRIELSCEGQRWGDIHRLINDDLAPTAGIPGKVPNGSPAAAAYTLGTPYDGTLTAAIPYTDKRMLWPIPLLETNSNPVLAAQQNPGY